MANAGIYNALMQPVRSVADFEEANRRNALLQIQLGQAEDAAKRQQAVRSAFSGGINEQAANALLQAGAVDEAMQVQRMLASQAQAQQQAQDQRRQRSYLDSLNPGSGVAKPFNAAEAAAVLGPDMAGKLQGLIAPKVKVKDYKQVRMPDGSVQLVGLGEDGQVVQTGQRPFIAPEVRDFGGYVGGVDLTTGKVQRYGDKTMSAADRDASARGWAGIQQQKAANEIQRQAQRSQIVETPNGPMLVDRGTGQASPVMMAGQPVKGESTMKRESGARQVLGLIDQAQKIVPTATGSYAGALFDEAARLVGAATSGSEGTARLQAIEGALLAQMPRMEGPQSNLDVQMYKQAAGAIGDPTIPRARKLAAIEELRAIQQRYAGVAPAPSQPTGGGLSPQEQAELEALRKRFGKGQ